MSSDMTDSQHPNRKKKKWFPKVKTGCLTCKRRRVKCGEERPNCIQCLRNHLQCTRFDDPYGSISATKGSPLLSLSTRSPQLVGSLDIRDVLYLTPMIANDNSDSYGVRSADYYEFLCVRSRELASYVFYLPSRIGSDIALDSAIKSLASILRDIYIYLEYRPVGPFRATNKTIFLYTQALEILQQALYDTQRSLSADVLCATEILCVFECLRGEDARAALGHSKGAARLIQHRGPQRFTTDFERSLLTSQLPSMLTRVAYFNKTSFLDTEDWADVLQSSISSGLQTVDRSQFSLCYYINALPIATAIVKCFRLVLNENTLPDDQRERERLVLVQDFAARAKAIAKWVGDMINHNPQLMQIKPDEHVVSRWQDHVDMMYATILSYRRFYAGINGGSSHKIEVETQQMARDLLISHNTRQKLYSQRSASLIVQPICQSIIDTAEEWLEFSLKSLTDGVEAKIVSHAMCLRWTLSAGFNIHSMIDNESSGT